MKDNSLIENIAKVKAKNFDELFKKIIGKELFDKLKSTMNPESLGLKIDTVTPHTAREFEFHGVRMEPGWIPYSIVINDELIGVIVDKGFSFNDNKLKNDFLYWKK